MIDTRTSRLFALGVLLFALFASFVGFGTLTPNPQAGRYPGTDEIARDANAYLGERVVVSGTVVQTDPLVVRDDYEAVRNGAFVSDTLRVTVTDVATTPDRGATLQVYGTLTAPRTVRAIETVAVPARNYLYMYGVSFVAGLWVLIRLLRRWRLDWQRFAVVPRDDPARLVDIARRTGIHDTEDDADA